MQKQKTVILDSSVWIAYLFTDDSHHQTAVEVFQTIFKDDYKILVPEIVFYEVMSVTLRKDRFDLAKYFMSLDFITVS